MVAITAGTLASSTALIGFGLDSVVEVSSAAAVAWQFSAADHAVREAREKTALRISALSFFALAAYVTVEGVRDLFSGEKPDTSLVGIVLTGVSIVIMPWLARAKRKAGLEMNSRLVVADAAETKLCAWLSVSTFAGLLAFAFFGWTWLDPVAGFVIAAFAIMEGKEAWEGELVCDDGCEDDDKSAAAGEASSCSDGCK